MKKSYLLLHTAALLAGFTGIFGKLISLNEGLLVWYRLLFSFRCLLIILRILRIKTAFPLREKLHIGRPGMLIALHWVFFYASIKYANISIGVVCYSLTSFFTAFFAPLIQRRQFSLSEIGLSLLTLAGILLIFHFDASFQLGIMLGIISSAFGALYTISNESLVKKYDSKVLNYYQMLGGTIGLGCLLPLHLYYFPVASLLPSLQDSFYLLLLAAFCSVLLYVLFAESLKRLSAFTVNLTFNLEPIYAIVLAFLFFGEGKQVKASFYAGLVLVGLSVVLQTLLSIKKKS